jgi:sulfur carrier protein ThiS adenylyltransferase
VVAKAPDWLSRNPPALQKITGKRVGIIGLGGLGSNITMMLARAGVTSFRLVDFDTVSIENLNRQHYFLHHLGQKKTLALAAQLRELTPSLTLELLDQRIEEHDLEDFCRGCDVLVEAVDDAATKAMLFSWFVRHSPSLWLVTASGLGSLGPANEIHTVRLAERIVACGDFVTSSEGQNGVCAPRVMVAAAHQALAVLRILTGMEP